MKGFSLRPLDEFDRRILRELMRDSRQTLAELAGRVGLSATPCWRRMKALEEDGVIQGYGCRVDAAAVGLGIEAFVQVTLSKHGGFEIDAFVTAIGRLPNVLNCYALTGPHDALVHVAAADLAAFNRFLMDELARIPGVDHLNSSIVLNRLVAHNSLPLT